MHSTNLISNEDDQRLLDLVMNPKLDAMERLNAAGKLIEAMFIREETIDMLTIPMIGAGLVIETISVLDDLAALATVTKDDEVPQKEDLLHIYEHIMGSVTLILGLLHRGNQLSAHVLEESPELEAALLRENLSGGGTPPETSTE